MLKGRTLQLIDSAKTSGEAYVKDAVVRLLVEVIKKDWPLSWPNMLSEVAGLSWKGAPQAHLVLLTLLRLEEDAKTFEIQPNHTIRRAVVQNMQTIFSLTEDLLQGYWYKYKHPAPGESHDRACLSTIVTALNALARYIDWVPRRHFTSNDYQLLKMMWHFLEDPELQLEACECLLVAMSRIGVGIRLLLDEFADVAIRYLTPVKMTDGEELTDRRYFFLRSQCLLICVLLEQFCSVMDSNITMKSSSNLWHYLYILLEFTTHSSQYLSFLTQGMWQRLFLQACLTSNPLVQAMVPKYLRATRMNLVKEGFPSQKNSPRCEYSRLEFGGDKDFSDFLLSFREEQRLAIEAAFQLDQRTCYQIVFEYLKKQLSASVDPGPMNSATADTLCHASSQPFLQWEAVTFFVKVIIEKMLKILNKENMPVNYCIEILHRVKKFKTEDPLILACVQTTIATLNPFLNCKREFSSQVLSKFIDMICEIKAPKAQTLKSIRRSECSRFIQVCQENAQYLLLDVGMLTKQVSQLLCFNTPMQMMEKGTVMEAMVIIINQFKNYDLQKAFLEELMAPIVAIWQSNNMELTISNPSYYLNFADNFCNNNPIMKTPLDLNRFRIMDCVSPILGVLRWSCWPSDLEEAKTGGFVVGYMHGGRPIYRNPCTELVQKPLESICLLLKTLHNLYSPQAISNLSYSFARDLDPLELENDSTLDLPQPLLDIFDPPEYKTAQERIKAFFCTLHEACFSVLGHAMSTMNEDFYIVMDHVNQLFDLVFEYQKTIPPHRLRPMICAFLKPLVHSCPPEDYECLFPIMKRIFSIFQTKLSDEWNIINQRNMTRNESTAVESSVAENSMSEKPLEIQVKLLTDEFMEFLFACCVPTEDASVTAAPSDACCKDADASVVVAATANEVCGVSPDVEDAVCTPESDDEDDCACSAEAGDGAAVSDGDCCVPTGNDSASAADLDEGEMAAEVPLTQPAPPEVPLFLLWPAFAELPLLSTQLAERKEPAELTMLGVCLLTEEELRISLLLTAFSSLVWNDSVTCLKIATRLCWPLLKQVISEPLAAEHMISLLNLVLSGIQKHKDDLSSRDALVNLAFHICESLRPHHERFSHLINMDPHSKGFYLETFDLIHFSEEFQHQENMTKDDLKCLIDDCTNKPLGMMSQDNSVHSPEPPSLKRTNPPISDDEPDNGPPPAKNMVPPLPCSPLATLAVDDHLL